MINDALFVAGVILILLGSWLIAPGLAVLLLGVGLAALAIQRAERKQDGAD